MSILLLVPGIDVLERGAFDMFPRRNNGLEINHSIPQEAQCFLKADDRW